MNTVDKKQILTWTIVILAIIGLFIGLAFLGGGGNNPANTAKILTTPVNEALDHIKGPNTAKVTLLEYSDFQCPACGQYEPILREVANAFPNDLRIVYRHFPLIEIHPNALPAAIASEAAAKQGKFWEMHDILFDRQSQWVDATSTESLFADFATSLSLDKNKFIADLTANDTVDRVMLDRSSAENAGLGGTPTFFLNGTQAKLQTLEEFKTAIQKIIDTSK